MATSIAPLPSFFISQETLESRTALFVSTKLPLLTGALGKPDTQNIWYSRQHIATLLDEIDYYGGDGMRIFLGMYEPGHKYEGQLCLVMNPTRSVTAGSVTSHQNVIAENEPDFSSRSAQTRDFQYPPDGDGGRDRGSNYGSPCPPLCD